jgi:hypothetical protein
MSSSELSDLVKSKPVLLGLLVVLGAGLLAVGGPAVAADSPAPTQDGVDTAQNNNTINLTLEPANGKLTPGLVPGEPQQYELVVEGAVDGISAYNATISIEDSNVANITGFEEQFEQPVANGTDDLSKSEILDGGSTLSLRTALGNSTYDGAEEIVVADVFIQANASAFPGQGTLALNQWNLTTSNVEVRDNTSGVEPYQNGAVGLAPQDVAWFDVNGNGNPAADVNGDGLLGDVRGDNGAVNLFDALELFDSRNAVNTEEFTPYFDFTQDGAVNLFDALQLFDERNQRT